MWSELRADAVLREVAALRDSGLDVVDVHGHALASIARVVPFDAACVGAVDPDSLLLTSGVTIGFAPSDAESERFVELEYGIVDEHSFSSLVQRSVPVVADAGDVAPTRRRDARFNELVRLMGFAHDVRLTFTADGSCWAVGDLYRSGAGDGFDAREVEFLERASALVAHATRAAIHQPETEVGVLPLGAAVLMVEADGAVSGMTAAAQDWIGIGGAPDVDTRLWWAIRTAVATARRGVPSAYTRVRRGTSWIVVKASALRTGDATAPVAVTIDEAGARDLADLFMAAHGITRRERDVCHEVMAGRSTKEIADRLHIAPHTVQDHLKSIFAKAGVRSRRELVASFAG